MNNWIEAQGMWKEVEHDLRPISTDAFLQRLPENSRRSMRRRKLINRKAFVTSKNSLDE